MTDVETRFGYPCRWLLRVDLALTAVVTVRR